MAKPTHGKGVYDELYRRQAAGKRFKRYGHSNEGRDAVEEVLHLFDLVEVVHQANAKPILSQHLVDFGCGHNEFAKKLREDGYSTLGLDVSCPGADAKCSILDAIPVVKEYGYLPSMVSTAFDMLEHLVIDELPKALNVLAQVAPVSVVSMGYNPSGNKLDGVNLHPIVRPEAWWRKVFEKRAHDVEQFDRYFVVWWKDEFRNESS